MAVNMERDTDLITVEEAAQRFGVPVTTVRSWYKTGKIRKYQRQIDKLVFVRASDIEAGLSVLPAEEETSGEGDEA